MKCKGCGKEVDKLKAKGLCGACYVGCKDTVARSPEQDQRRATIFVLSAIGTRFMRKGYARYAMEKIGY